MVSNISSLLRHVRDAVTAAVAAAPRDADAGVASGPGVDADPLLSMMFDDLAEVEATIASLHASRAELLNRARDRHRATAPEPIGHGAEMTERVFRAELATTLRVSERFADELIHTAEALVERVPCTFAELRGGAISYAHAREIANASWGLGADELAGFEEAVVPVACARTVSGLRRKLRQLKEALAPETLVERHRAARAQRHVSLTPADDGMAWLTAYLPVVQATAIRNRLTDTAKSLRVSGEPRTRAQLMVDVFLDEHIPLTAWAGEDPMIRAFRTGIVGEGAWGHRLRRLRATWRGRPGRDPGQIPGHPSPGERDRPGHDPPR